MDFFTCNIQPEESIENFVLCLRTFSTQLRALQVVVTELQLTNTFIYGLCDNFCDIKTGHNKKTIEWHTHELEWAKRKANGIKQNLIKNNNWIESTPLGFAHPAQFNETLSSGKNEQQ
eukprot:3571803-Ditylum_brightwellii.AAC.1